MLCPWIVSTKFAEPAEESLTGKESDALSPVPSRAMREALCERRTGEIFLWNLREPFSTPWSIIMSKPLESERFQTFSLAVESQNLSPRKAIEQAWKRSGISAKKPAASPTLIFANLVDFDMLYGHRRDVPRLRRMS